MHAQDVRGVLGNTFCKFWGEISIFTFRQNTHAQVNKTVGIVVDCLLRLKYYRCKSMLGCYIRFGKDLIVCIGEIKWSFGLATLT